MRGFASLLLLLLPLLAPAQARPVPTAEKLWSKQVWRLVDLREVPNAPLFRPGQELGRLLIAAVRADELVPYRSDSVQVPLTRADFEARLLTAAPMINTECDTTCLGYEPCRLTQLIFREEMIFDKRHGRLVREPHALTLGVPELANPWLCAQTVASFRYDELVRYCRAYPTTAVWQPAPDSTRTRRPALNLAVVLEQALFHSYICKLSNPDDVDFYELARGNPDRIFALSQQAAQWLAEVEARMWNPVSRGR